YSTTNSKGAAPSTPPPIVGPPASTLPSRSTSCHGTFDSNVREQPNTVSPDSSTSPELTFETMTNEDSATSGRRSAQASSGPGVAVSAGVLVGVAVSVAAAVPVPVGVEVPV